MDRVDRKGVNIIKIILKSTTFVVVLIVGQGKVV
jgi:hypothetical protein